MPMPKCNCQQEKDSASRKDTSIAVSIQQDKNGSVKQTLAWVIEKHRQKVPA